MKKTLLALAACLAITGTAFASNEPITFTDDTHYYTYPVFTEEPNKELEDKANSIVKDTIAHQDELLTNHTDGCVFVSLGYELFNDGGAYLSFMLKPGTNTGGAHGNYVSIGYTFDAETGNRLTAQDFYPSLTKESLFEAITSGKFPVYGVDRKLIKPSALLLTNIQDFNPRFDSIVIDRNGNIYMVFSPYDLAPYAAGTTFVGLPSNK